MASGSFADLPTGQRNFIYFLFLPWKAAMIEDCFSIVYYYFATSVTRNHFFVFLGRTEPIPLVKKEDSLCLGRLTLEVFTVWWKLPLKVNVMSILAFFSLLFLTKITKCITRISHKNWISEVTGFRSCLDVYVCSPSRVHFLICCWNETRKINLTFWITSSSDTPLVMSRSFRYT